MADHSAWRLDLARTLHRSLRGAGAHRRPRRLGRSGRRRPLVGHRHARLLGRDRPRLARDAARCSGRLDELIEGVLSGESTDTTSLDVLRGAQEAIVLFGEERYEPIRARVLDYPDALRRSMVEAHLKFTPSWIYDGMGHERGDLVVFYEYVLATMRNVVGVLAGLNRVYVAPDKLKRVGAVVSRMELTPPDAAARLDALLDLPREQVKPELDDLVDEHLPDFDTAPARESWSRQAEPSDGA